MEFGYWKIRGLGAPFRMMLAYKEVKYQDPPCSPKKGYMVPNKGYLGSKVKG